MSILFIHHIELLQNAIHLWDDSSKQENEGSNFPCNAKQKWQSPKGINLFSLPSISCWLYLVILRAYIHDFCTSCWYVSCLRNNGDVLGLIVGDREMFINASCYSKCGCDRQVYFQRVCESILSCRCIVDQHSVCYKLL